jgi:hypothetical protein
MTGVAAIGCAQSLSALGTALQGPFELTVAEGRAAFDINGRAVWVIDTRRFGGKPVLKTTREERLIRLELTDAMYPGTQLSADMSCEIRRQSNGWRMKLRLALGHFACEAPFESWLAGTHKALSGVNLDGPICEPRGGRAMLMKGAAQAEFSPNWMLKLAGTGICHVSGLGEEILSDFLALSLLESSEPGLTTHPATKRTLISLRRGERSWPIELMPQSAEGWKVLATDHSFDMLHLETGEFDDGSVGAQALVAESNVGEANLMFCPSAHLKDIEGKPFALPLRQARYAVAFDGRAEQAALVARFAEEPVRLNHRSVSVRLGDTAETTHFELVCIDGRALSLRCSPAVLGLASSLPGAIVEHCPPAPGSHLSFRLGALGPAQQETHHAPGKTATPGLLRIEERETNPPEINLSLSLKSISVLRPEDLLYLNFDFINLALDDSMVSDKGQKLGPMIRKTNSKLPSFIVVRFPPQHLIEEALEEKEDNSQGQAWPGLLRKLPSSLAAVFLEHHDFPVRARLSGESRLVFRVPEETLAVPYTLESLLDWGSFVPQLASTALLPAPPKAEDQVAEIPPQLLTNMSPEFNPDNGDYPYTFIEAPAKLYLTPHEAAAWAHAREAVLQNGRNELWHTRLGVRGTDEHPEAQGLPDGVDEQNDYYRTLRAINYEIADPKNFTVSLTGDNRRELKQLTTDFSVPGCRERVINVERLMLTALGAWMNVRYAAEPPQGFTLEEWRHRMTMGREHYVRVVTKGYLFPFGHRASFITITERKFRTISSYPETQGVQNNQVGAFLVQRRFVIVRQPVKRYGETKLKVKDAGQTGGFGVPPPKSFNGEERIYRMLPFKSLRLTTLVTPNLKKQVDDEIDVLRTLQDGQPMMFHFIAEDRDGQLVDFTAPLIFVPASDGGTSDKNSGAFLASAMKPVAKKYAALDPALRERPLQGQRVSFAQSVAGPPPPGSAPQNATSFETESITFDAFVSDEAKDYAADQPAFVPVMAQSVIRVQAVEQLAGSKQRPTVHFHSAYLEHEFDPGPQGALRNPGEVFFELTGKSGIALDFKGQADKAGGLATPNIRIDGLSRKFGAVGDSTQLAKGNFSPATFFDGDNAKILGGISLKAIIKSATLDQSNDAKVPRLANTIVRDANGLPVENRTELTWNPSVQSDQPLQLFKPKGVGDKLSLTARIITPLAGNGSGSGEPPFYVHGLLEHFALNFLGLVTVNFAKLELTMQSGKKLDVSAALEDSGAVTFGGPLSFMNVLAEHIPSTGFSDPPSLDVDANGVSVGYSLSLPEISAGAWAVRDLSLGATLHIPFTGTNSTSLRFNFSERHNPFQVAAYGVTGGAFFAISLGLGKIESVEASLEVGGSLSLNLGVASGAVFLMIGIHMVMVTEPETQVSLGGYVRTGGALSVLGLITVSVEFYMELAYLIGPNRMRGEASLSVKVKVLFFSKTVTLTVVRELDAPQTSARLRLLDQPAATESAHLANEEAWARYCDAFA